MLNAADLDAYLKRIQEEDKIAADIFSLRRLQRAHATHIPFENIDSLTGLPVKLDLPSLMQKLVHGKRGGYCFEQNLLMAQALERAGFSVSILAARPLWHLSAGELPDPLVTGLPRSHVLLLVSIEGGRWLVDVGFGGYTPLGPIALVVDEVQSVVHDTFRLITHQQGYILQALIRGQWKPMYVFDLQAQQQADLEMMNYWVSSSPESRFTTNLILAFPHAGGRHAFINTALAGYDWQGNEKREHFLKAEEILQMLENNFGLGVSGNERLKQKVQQLLEAAVNIA